MYVDSFKCRTYSPVLTTTRYSRAINVYIYVYVDSCTACIYIYIYIYKTTCGPAHSATYILVRGILSYSHVYIYLYKLVWNSCTTCLYKHAYEWTRALLSYIDRRTLHDSPTYYKLISGVLFRQGTLALNTSFLDNWQASSVCDYGENPPIPHCSTQPLRPHSTVYIHFAHTAQ